MEKKFKRQYRERDTATKMKISNALKNRTKSVSHCQAISDGLKAYWQTVPSQKNENNNPLNNNGKM
jgi:hypothetical protein